MKDKFTILIKGWVAERVRELRTSLGTTYNNTIKQLLGMSDQLFEALDENMRLKIEIDEIEQKVLDDYEKHNDELRDLLKASISRPINIGQQMLQTAQPLIPPPLLSGPPKLPPKHIIPISQNVKDDLKKELDSIFNGEIPRPSLVLKAVEHSESLRVEESVEKEKEVKDYNLMKEMFD